MNAVKWAVAALITYAVLAECRHSAWMRRRQRERDLHWNRPAAPVSSMDIVTRVYLLAGVFIAGCLFGGLFFHGCS